VGKGSSTTEIRRLSVAFTPYSVRNPYQTLLRDALSANAVEVCGVDMISLVLGLKRLPNVTILHIHWLDRVLRPSTLVTRILSWSLIQRVKSLRKKGVQIVWTVHNLGNHERLQPAIERELRTRLSELADLIIVHGPSARRSILDVLPPTGVSKIRIIPHGNYMSWYKPAPPREEARRRLDLPPNSRILLLLGFIRPYKGVIELIDNFRRLESENVFLLIAGDIQSDFELQVRIAVSGDTRIRCDFKYIDDQTLPYYFGASDACVFPYHRSLTSGALVLAMGFGVPCVAPRVGAFQDVMGESSKFLYDPDDPAGFYRTLLDIAHAKNSDLQEQGERLLERIKELDWSKIGQCTIDAYQESRVP